MEILKLWERKLKIDGYKVRCDSSWKNFIYSSYYWCLTHVKEDDSMESITSLGQGMGNV